MLEIKNLSKKYSDGKLAVDCLNMVVEDGDVYGFIGKNGAGKTTTLKSCFGMIPFDSGEILLDGVSILEEPLRCKKAMAFVPDSPCLEEYMTGIQYINFVCDMYEVSQKKRVEKINYYALKFCMQDQLGNLISSYSHGMKQKLALISAFVHEPKLLVLDEPFVGLDPQAFIILKQEMKSLCENGASVLFSSHILDVVEKVCNKLCIIKHGKVVCSGNTKDVIGNKNLEEVFVEVCEYENNYNTD
ncbi:ABC transporter ATP-binding protein [Clostridium sp. BNL1100]|uniref:ABC transporter ATP-binding protein n=1 Tax=Clostridium sp. BNL1100 TaxID=755731 RepID=UPI00024A71BD|nr:ABC transporter ATP-binding protein [Clostridium sp. BNL1100]AEY67205.1 ABC-type multidrug transport system, ATPase component [Clostridium sp. BNL1100]